jgi:hypothetical protein
MRMLRPSLLILAAAALAGCSDSYTPTAPRPDGVRAAFAESSLDANAQDIAHAIARAMNRQDVRIQIRNAFRASRVTEHKLVLQEFVHTPAGRHLVRAAAEASGTTPAAFEARIAALPELDFYLPFRAHRASWRGTGDILVGATFTPKEPVLLTYGTDGTATALDSREGIPSRPMIVLHPAEQKSLRFHPQPDTRGDVVQDFRDGELSGSVDQGEDMTTLDCDPYARTCFSVGGGGTTAPADTTLVKDLWINYTDGFGWAGSNEVELRTTFYRNGAVIASKTARFEGISNNTWYHPNALLIYQRPIEGSADYFRIRVVETDNFDSDDKGTRNFYTTDNGERRSVIDNGSSLETQSVTTIMLGWTPRW